MALTELVPGKIPDFFVKRMDNMPNEQNQMKKRYRVCILAYSRVAHVAREVVRELADSDIEYIILESGLADEQAAWDVKYL
jgi:hypothetical protein